MEIMVAVAKVGRRRICGECSGGSCGGSDEGNLGESSFGSHSGSHGGINCVSCCRDQ